MNNFQLGWVCGFLEGEASFSICERKRTQVRNGRASSWRDYTANVRAAQVDRSVLDKLAAVTGVGAVRHKKTYSPLSKKRQFEWRVGSRREMREFLPLIRPHMSKRRKQRIDELLVALKRSEA